MSNLDDLKLFNIGEAELKLWTFKKQSPPGRPPSMNGHWVAVTPEMASELKDILYDAVNSPTELFEYTHLAQNNEGSLLALPADETHMQLLVDSSANPTQSRKTRNIKTIYNALFYVVKLISGDETFYAVKKTHSSWRSKSQKSLKSIVYVDQMIDLVDDNNFKIEKDFDFFCFRGEIFIKNKSNFESVLNYREAFEADFSELRQDPEFITKFSELDALVNHVGTNRMHLRRMSAIRQKGFYADEAFMQLLHENYREYGLEINFDADGKIIPCAATCADIMTALLDHRLRSGFSNNLYDVQNTTPVEA